MRNFLVSARRLFGSLFKDGNTAWRIALGAFVLPLSCVASQARSPSRPTAASQSPIGPTNPSAPAAATMGLPSGDKSILAAGARHTCEATREGMIRCWGNNAQGQLGDGTTTGRLTPVGVVGFPKSDATITGLAAGAKHTCVVLSGQEILCWGDNTLGQLGNIEIGRASNVPVPVEQLLLPGSTSITAIAAGSQHTCIALSNGKMICWGSNSDNQLGGGGEKTPREPPLRVSGFPVGGDIVAIAAGEKHTCAAISNGRAYCWGSNANGQLGRASDDTGDVLMPVILFPNSGEVTINALAAGGDHSCAALSNREIYCWGSNSDGQLGSEIHAAQKVLANANAPRVPGHGNFATALSAGKHHTCVAISNGQAFCWGADWEGQLGDGDSVPSQELHDPVRLPEMGIGIAMGSGGNHTCIASRLRGTLCWGENREGQLGNGTTNPTLVPVRVR